MNIRRNGARASQSRLALATLNRPWQSTASSTSGPTASPGGLEEGGNPVEDRGGEMLGLLQGPWDRPGAARVAEGAVDVPIWWLGAIEGGRVTFNAFATFHAASSRLGERRRFRAGWAVDVGRDLVARRPAEQLVDRDTEGRALEIPEPIVDRRGSARWRGVAYTKSCRGRGFREMFDPSRILPDQARRSRSARWAATVPLAAFQDDLGARRRGRRCPSRSASGRRCEIRAGRSRSGWRRSFMTDDSSGPLDSRPGATSREQNLVRGHHRYWIAMTRCGLPVHRTDDRPTDAPAFAKVA